MATIDATELAGWTPVGLDLEAETPAIEWGDLRGLRFTDPFFDDTVARWTASDPPPPRVRTGLDALAVLDQAPTLDPSGFVFHLSRCGSTLLTRLLQQIPDCIVVSEPSPVNSLLLADVDFAGDDTQARLLRLLIRALGRRRFGDERHYVVKLSSWNVCRFDLFRRAFPSTPMIWLQRDPAEVVASLLARSPEWLRLQREPDVAAALFGIPAAEVAKLEPAVFYVRALAALLKAARNAPPAAMTTLDYSDLPQAAWTTVAHLFALAPEAGDVARMQDQARYYSKDASPRLFKPRPTPIPSHIRRLAAEELGSLYAALSARKASIPAPPRSGAEPA